jgi:26S proteasome regulatory subunit N12
VFSPGFPQPNSTLLIMASNKLATLYKELQRSFDARPSDLKKCGTLLAQLKVYPECSNASLCMTDIMLGWLDRSRHIDPSRRSKSPRLGCRSYVRIVCSVLSIDRGTGDILEIGVFWSIRAEDIPSFDRYFSQLHTFYTDYRCVSASYPDLLSSQASDQASLRRNVNSQFVA